MSESIRGACGRIKKELHWITLIFLLFFTVQQLFHQIRSRWTPTQENIDSFNKVPEAQEGLPWFVSLLADYYIEDFDANITEPDWNNLPQPHIVIKVLAYNRLPSLQRALESLKKSYYDGDQVDLDVFIDHIPVQTDEANYAKFIYPNVQLDDEQIRGLKEYMTSSEIEELKQILTQQEPHEQKFSKNHIRLAETHNMIYFLSQEFEWPFGEKRIHYRHKNVGLQSQWIEQWWPASMDEFAFVVEDDVVVSPWWYRYMKKAIQAYYYDDRLRDDNVFGISTQNQAYSVGKDERGVACVVSVTNHNRPFLFATIGTWGQLLFPKHWIEFRLWYDMVKSDPDYSPLIEGVGKSHLRTTAWYKNVGNAIWTPWFIRFLEKKRYYGLYANFGSRRFLSVSYQEKGVSYGKAMGTNLSASLINRHEFSISAKI
jgi:hypothetical protein